MAKSFLKHTRTSLGLIVKEVKLISFIVNISAQVVFTLFYSFLIYQNKDHIQFMVVYIVLAALALIGIPVRIIARLTDGKKEDRSEFAKVVTSRKFKMVLKSIGYVMRLFGILFSLYAVSVGERSFLYVVAAIISAISLGASILVDIITTLVIRYVEYLKAGWKLDMQKNPINAALHPGKAAMKKAEAIDNPDDEEMNKYEQRIIENTPAFEEEQQDKKKEDRKLLKQALPRLIKNTFKKKKKAE